MSSALNIAAILLLVFTKTKQKITSAMGHPRPGACCGDCHLVGSLRKEPGVPEGVVREGRPVARDSRLVHGAKTRRLHFELGIKKKEKGRKMAEVSFALLCPSRTAESHSQIVVSTLFFRNLIARGAGSLRPSSGCTCFGLDQFVASAS